MAFYCFELIAESFKGTSSKVTKPLFSGDIYQDNPTGKDILKSKLTTYVVGRWYPFVAPELSARLQPHRAAIIPADKSMDDERGGAQRSGASPQGMKEPKNASSPDNKDNRVAAGDGITYEDPKRLPRDPEKSKLRHNPDSIVVRRALYLIQVLAGHETFRQGTFTMDELVDDFRSKDLFLQELFGMLKKEVSLRCAIRAAFRIAESLGLLGVNQFSAEVNSHSYYLTDSGRISPLARFGASSPVFRNLRTTNYEARASSSSSMKIIGGYQVLVPEIIELGLWPNNSSNQHNISLQHVWSVAIDTTKTPDQGLPDNALHYWIRAGTIIIGSVIVTLVPDQELCPQFFSVVGIENVVLNGTYQIITVHPADTFIHWLTEALRAHAIRLPVQASQGSIAAHNRSFTLAVGASRSLYDRGREYTIRLEGIGNKTAYIRVDQGRGFLFILKLFPENKFVYIIPRLKLKLEPLTSSDRAVFTNIAYFPCQPEPVTETLTKIDGHYQRLSGVVSIGRAIGRSVHLGTQQKHYTVTVKSWELTGKQRKQTIVLEVIRPDGQRRNYMLYRDTRYWLDAEKKIIIIFSEVKAQNDTYLEAQLLFKAPGDVSIKRGIEYLPPGAAGVNDTASSATGGQDDNKRCSRHARFPFTVRKGDRLAQRKTLAIRITGLAGRYLSYEVERLHGETGAIIKSDRGEVNIGKRPKQIIPGLNMQVIKIRGNRADIIIHAPVDSEITKNFSVDHEVSSSVVERTTIYDTEFLKIKIV
ncbi:MAG: hypothetical protein KKF80_03950, partial [Candidatus Omnitrophica bacterium]|nr:hypothetical protein [Candidatus Omnitrophota bacterium]